MSTKLYRSYSYVIFGAEKVGKTNLITRFTKDEFTQAHNMTLEGQQTAILSIDGRMFEISIYDTAGQQNMISMKAVWRSNKNGFIFVFALNNSNSFKTIIAQIQEIKQQPPFQNIAAILVGNKSDLEYDREVTKQQATAVASRLGMKYFQVSAKASFKEQIDRLVFELIDLNQMERFQDTQESTQSTFFDKLWHPCEDGKCQIM